MRSDMSKVLIEAGRTNSSAPSKKWGKRINPNLDHDEYECEIIGKVSSARRRQYGYNHRESTDVLGPLKNYLRSCVGRPWDEVYSEICANLDKRKTTGAHVFTHLWQYVDLNCWIGEKTGKVYTNSDRGIHTVSWFYVHPFTGLLCDSEMEGWSARYRRPKPIVTLVQIGDPSECKAYEWINGHWYYTEYSWINEIEYHQKWGWGTEWFTKRGKIGRYHKHRKEVKVYQLKRQLSKKELRDLKLSNRYLKTA